MNTQVVVMSEFTQMIVFTAVGITLCFLLLCVGSVILVAAEGVADWWQQNFGK